MVVNKLLKYARPSAVIPGILLISAIFDPLKSAWATDLVGLDDVTMQVIEMEELPDDVMEVIPLPTQQHQIPDSPRAGLKSIDNSVIIDNANLLPGQTQNLEQYSRPPVDPATGLPYDPEAVRILSDPQSLPVDPQLGIPLHDPNYDIPLDPNTGLPQIDVQSGEPIMEPPVYEPPPPDATGGYEPIPPPPEIPLDADGSLRDPGAVVDPNN